ncbi:hypothetical protein [Sphingomonas sp.]|uniref:hypothetical protein n=1 Tax=Sphingomonas sp. TaxID=28214 RepID=UPI002BD416EA|nr:hypothetical protein [Sphingomonas sp.]HWK35490.1 hypothetical protein [Sphingomonas sp.]
MKHLLATAALIAICGATGAIAQPTGSAAAGAAVSVEKSAKVAPGGLYEIVFNPADKRVYVAATGQRGSNAPQVVALDATTLAPVRTIDVAPDGVFGLGIDTRAQLLYGTATRTGAVVMIDLKSGKTTALKPEGSEGAHLREVVIDEATGKAYASVMVGSERGDGPVQPQQIWVIDGKAGKFERVISVDTNRLTGLTVGDGKLFATGMGSNEVVVIDAATGNLVSRWPSGGEAPINIAYDRAGKRLFVANQKSGDLTVLDSTTGAVKAKVPTGEGALSVAYNPAKQQAYVANRQAGTVSVIDATTYQSIANLPTGTFPQTLAVDAAGNRVFVSNKARGLPRNAPAGTAPVDDANGDTVTTIRL